MFCHFLVLQINERRSDASICENTEATLEAGLHEQGGKLDPPALPPRVPDIAFDSEVVFFPIQVKAPRLVSSQQTNVELLP